MVLERAHANFEDRVHPVGELGERPRVSVALGRRDLRVAQKRLHSRRIETADRERRERVAQMVEGQRRQTRRIACRAVAAPERRVVKWTTRRPAEDVVLRAGEALAPAELVEDDERLARQRYRSPFTRLRAAVLARGHAGHDHDRSVGEADVFPAERAQLPLAEACEASHGVERRVLCVGAGLLHVPFNARPSAAAVHVPTLAGLQGFREPQWW